MTGGKFLLKMAIRIDPWKKIGRPEYEGIHKLPFDFERRAETHEMNRQRTVGKILVDLYLMAVKGFVGQGVPITVSGAESQSLWGSRDSDTEAAHCAPRQLYIGSEKMQDVLRTKFPERGLAVEALFGETDILPKNFNKSDSRAEGCGMAEGFRFAAERVVFAAGIDGALDKEKIAIAIKSAHGFYREYAARALMLALTQLETKVNRIAGSKVKHTLRTKEEEKWREQYGITKLYLSNINQSSGLLTAVDPPILDGLIKIYSEI